MLHSFLKTSVKGTCSQHLPVEHPPPKSGHQSLALKLPPASWKLPWSTPLEQEELKIQGKRGSHANTFSVISAGWKEHFLPTLYSCSNSGRERWEQTCWSFWFTQLFFQLQLTFNIISYWVLSHGSKGVTELYHHFSHFFVLSNLGWRLVTRNSTQTKKMP